MVFINFFYEKDRIGILFIMIVLLYDIVKYNFDNN